VETSNLKSCIGATVIPNKNSAAFQIAKHVYGVGRDAIQSCRQLWAQWRSRRTIKGYLSHSGFRGLQVGCGPHHLDGWLNSDLLDNPDRDIFIDITRPLPFPDNSLDAVYAGEVIEHVSEPHGRLFLSEVFRALKPNGVLRLTTPDLRDICRLFLDEHPAANIDQFGSVWKGGSYTRERWLNAQFRAHGHQFIWSFEYLTEALKQTGFESVLRCPPRATYSPFAELASLERHYGEAEPAWVFARTIIIEASKAALPTNKRLKHGSGSGKAKIPTSFPYPARLAG
jgi:predicted SAM-dependent methyltransferase